jgi:hypothetical protein
MLRIVDDLCKGLYLFGLIKWMLLEKNENKEKGQTKARTLL